MVIFVLLFGMLTLLAVSLLKSYRHISKKELTRRARKGDPLASALFKTVSHGLSLDLLLWFIVGISTALFFVILSRSVSAWLAFLSSVIFLWIAFAWIPKSHVSPQSLWIAKKLSPAIAWILEKLHPLLGRLAEYIHRHKPITIHSGIYEKDDLLELIANQQISIHNRIDKEELRVAELALVFGDKSVTDVMTPRKIMKTIKATEAIGPVLLDELHASGFSRFPVVGNSPEVFVGTLYLHDLVDLSTAPSSVKDIMDHKVYYIHEEAPLTDALGAFLKTQHHLFMVVNSFEEVVGIITLEDVVEQILGRQIVDEFDNYQNLRVVAEKEAKKDHKANTANSDEVIQ